MVKVYTTRWRIFEFIREFIDKKDYPPTIAEIQKSLGISANSVVEYHLKALGEEGFITREPEIARGIRLSSTGKRARRVPLLGTVSAGDPIPVPAEDTWHSTSDETVEVPSEMLSHDTQAFALRVKGTSMIDALVDDGDIVVLEATATADDGDMVAVWISETQEATLKRLYRESGGIRLQPANRSMAPIHVDPDKVQVQGRVIGVLRRYRNG